MQSVQPVFPGHPVVFKPVHSLFKRSSLDSARARLGGLRPADKPCILKNFEVFRDCWKAHFERLGKFLYQRVTGHQMSEDRPPCGICEC